MIDTESTPVQVGDLMNISEVSELTLTPAPTLRYWRSMKKGPRSFKLGGRVVYKRHDVLHWIEAQYAADAPEAETA